MRKIGIALFALGVAGCGGGGTATPEGSTPVAAEAAIGGASGSTEPNGTQALNDSSRSWWQRLATGLLPDALASGACPTLVTGTCASGSYLLTYTTCTFGSASNVWNGSQTVAFSGSCPATPLQVSSFNAQLVTRTFGPGTTETTSAGTTTTLDTTTAQKSGWDPSVTGVGNGETAQFTDQTGGRTIKIPGLHTTGTNSSGATLFDHTITSSGVTMTGTGTSRAAPSGTLTVQHNVAKYTAQVTITTPLAYTIAGCCHPSAGVLTAQLSGSKSGTETLTFNGGTCGAATYKDASGNSATFTLSHCY